MFITTADSKTVVSGDTRNNEQKSKQPSVMVRVTATFNCRHPSADCPTDVGYIADECQPSEVMASCTIVSHRLEPKRRFYVLLAWSNTDSLPHSTLFYLTAFTGKLKYVSGKGSLFRVKCHHSVSRGLNP